MELRPYQTQAVEAVRGKLREGAKRVLVVAPTGSGKTVMAADIIARANARGSRCLFFAHRRELVYQTSEKLSRFGVQHGLVIAGARAAPQREVQVASIQTLANRRAELGGFDVVFVDEAHHAAADSYQTVLEWFPNATVVGLTATPWRLDGRGLADLFDAYVLTREPRELRDDGFLVPVGGWEYEAIDTRGVHVRGGDFVQRELTEAASKPRVAGNIVAEWQAHAGGRRTVCFCVSIDASTALVERFKAAGVAAEHIDGQMATAERDAVLKRLRAGQTTVVCNCNVLTEGFDCPELEVCVLARPTLSTALYLQMVGRVLRPSPGKVQARIHDHAGCLRAHGHPYAPRDYSPELSAEHSRDDVEGEVAEARVLRCKACGSVRARYPCDACGWQPTPKERAVLEVEEARRIAIAEEHAGRMSEARTASMRAQFEAKSDDERFKAFCGFVSKHGPKKAVGVYHWWSGGTAWPDRAWRRSA